MSNKLGVWDVSQWDNGYWVPGERGYPIPPQAAIEYLKANLNTRDHFDWEYGPGAAERVLAAAEGNVAGTPRSASQ